MQQYLPMKICSLLLLMVMLIATINCGCAEAHGIDIKFKAGAELTSISSADSCPCCPQGEHHSSDDHYDACGGCICHLALPLPLFQLSYHPVFSDHLASSPYRHLPEVYLSKFIPPRSLV